MGDELLFSWAVGTGKKNEDVNNNEEVQSPSEDQVFSNDYLLSKILTYLSVPNLKLTRQVSSAWNMESTKLLLKQPTRTTILLDPEETGVAFLATEEGEVLKHDSLEKFVYLVQMSQRFPRQAFSVVGDLVDENLQWLFWCHGQNVKELTLEIRLIRCGSPELSLKMLEALLTLQLPNLEKLVLIGIPDEWKAIDKDESDIVQLFSKPIKLEKLTELDLFHCAALPQKVTSSILSAASNLESLRCDTSVVANLTLLLDLNKIHLLKSFRFCFRPSHMEAYLRTAESEKTLKLETLSSICTCKVDLDPGSETGSQVGKILTKCLESSFDTLQCIHRLTPIGSLPGLKFPRLPNLKHLSLEYAVLQTADNLPGRMFPQELNMAHTFPSLSTVDFYFQSSDFQLDPHDVFFNNVNPVPSVKHLDFYGVNTSVSINWIHYFSQMFPNLSILHFPRIQNFFGAAQYLWSWPSLEEIEFTIQLTAAHFQFPHIEAAFTGFSVQTCLQLYDLPDVNVDVVSKDSREFWSMLHLPVLTKLTVNFECSHDWSTTLDPVVLSRVTGIYAFQISPQVEVKIVALSSAVKDSLTGVFPYVKSHP